MAILDAGEAPTSRAVSGEMVDVLSQVAHANELGQLFRDNLSDSVRRPLLALSVVEC